MPEKVLLGFCIPVKKEREIKALCQKEKVLYKAVTASGYTKTLGSLAGIKGIPAAAPDQKSGEIPAAQILVFSGFGQEELFAFTDKMKGAGIESVSLKAMITMYNVFWTPKMLYEEIVKEHQKMTAGE